MDLAEYHHIINRGVNRSNIFNHNDDKEIFLQIINTTAMIHKVVLHDYALMGNHYHLLIETQKENLSTFKD
ncbi:MAG: transposase [Sulfurimonadaceae bacterium]